MTLTILVVDDDENNRRIVRDTLNLEGYEVIEARNGLEALEILQEKTPDLVFLDLAMPQKSGWEVAETLRRDTRLGKIPVIAFTALALAGDAEKAKASGCDDYLAKPCWPSDILEKVRRWVPPC